MLNFFTCVFFSMALAMSFSVGIGMFCKVNGGKRFWWRSSVPSMSEASEASALREFRRSGRRRATYLDVVEVDLREGGVVAFYPLESLLNVGGVRGFVEHGAHLLPFDHIWDGRTDRQTDNMVTLGRGHTKKRTLSLGQFVQLTVVAVFTRGPRVRLAAGDQ